jgi:hypothetical protein
MRISKRSFLLALAAGLLACSVGATGAMAGSVLAYEAEGTFDFVLTANGSGVFTISYTSVSLTKIDNALIPGGPIVSSFGNSGVAVTSTVSTPPLTSYTLFDPPPPDVQHLGTGAGEIDTAEVTFNLTEGFALSPSFLNLRGLVVGAPAPLLETSTTSPTIDNFAPFDVAGGTMSLTYNKVDADFAAVIANGGTITGTGAFTELANVIPEPTSIALFGIGLSGVLAFRRYFKRAVVA